MARKNPDRSILNDYAFLGLGIFLNLSASFLYALYEWNAVLLIPFLIGIALVTLFFLNRTRGTKIKFFDKKDWAAIVSLIAICAPLYLYALYTVPWQINSDEVSIMNASAKIISGEMPDIFGGMPEYFGFPRFSFFLFGKLAHALGGLNLFNTRLVHGLFGLGIIVISYFFFKIIFKEHLAAFAGALILGSNHALVGISRMAMRDNSALFVELAALTVLLMGLEKRSALVSFLGGLLAGLTWYVYYPARITIFIWFLTIAAIIFSYPRRTKTKIILACVGLNIFGFMLVALPNLIYTLENPASLGYQRQQFLIFQEGRELEKSWTGTENAQDAVVKNITNGLTTFNNKIHDQGYIYPNYGHGFVDPLTGVLIWIGLVVFLSKGKKNQGGILAVTGFLTLWLLLSFLITKSPHYTRLLSVLPFTAYLTVSALAWLGRICATAVKRICKANLPEIRSACILIGTAIIVAWNATIFSDFAILGFAQGNDIGSTARYIEEHLDRLPYAYYLAADSQYPYYSWGADYQWKTWLGFFVGNNQEFEIVKPEDIDGFNQKPPFTLFMNNNLWKRRAIKLKDRYPGIFVRHMKSDGSLVALEVQ